MMVCGGKSQLEYSTTVTLSRDFIFGLDIKQRHTL